MMVMTLISSRSPTVAVECFRRRLMTSLPVVAGRQRRPLDAPPASTLSNKLENRRRRSRRAPRRITWQRAIASWVTARITDCISAGCRRRCCLQRQIVNIAFPGITGAVDCCTGNTRMLARRRFLCRCRLENDACQAAAIVESKYNHTMPPSWHFFGVPQNNSFV